MASMSPSEKRLQKELMSLMKEPPPGMTVDSSAASQNLMQWIIQMDGAPGTLYEGEKFELLFKFSAKYPFDSPEVTFQGPNIPVHPHVYSNGHICLSILTEDWSPALSVQSVCLSIISMLSSCKEKKRPPDNSFYVKTCNKNPKKTKWWYHGKTRLLLAEKFKQFEGLVEQSANNTSEKEISINDLQGFWDLVLIQVNEIKEMFRGLGSLSSTLSSDNRKSVKSRSPDTDSPKQSPRSGSVLKKKSASEYLDPADKKVGEIREG